MLLSGLVEFSYCSLALGATHWEMIRLAVFPYARSGIVSAVMLGGLGRALGETMAVAMVLSASGVVTFNLISNTDPSTIAREHRTGSPNYQGTLVIAWERPRSRRTRVAGSALADAVAKSELASVRIGIATLAEEKQSADNGRALEIETLTAQVARGVLPGLAPSRHAWQEVRRAGETIR